MMRIAGWSSVKDGIERSLKIALGLVVALVVLVASIGPRSTIVTAKIAEAEARELAAARPQSAGVEPVRASPAAADTPVAPLPEQPADSLGRNVTPPSITAPVLPAASASLQRLPPRDPLSTPDPKEEDAAGEDIRLRLLHRPVALDTGTFLVDRGRIRLAGVQPVAPSRECGDGAGAWPCGMQARTALRLWLRGRAIRCDAPENFGKTDAAIDAECSLGPQDIGQWLVENGWAEARPDGRYTTLETKARDARRGIWGSGRGAPPPDTQ